MPEDDAISREDEANRLYWNDLAEEYQSATRISCASFHLGPLLPDAATLGLLPDSIEALSCLEIGCGAGQNSIFLASRGATCTAIDIAEQQLDHGRRLAAEHGVTVDFRAASMDALPADELGHFDFIHSTFALPFAADPAAVVATLAAMLKPGGSLLLTTAHPVFAGEWLEIEDEGEGIFLTNYFEPPADVRFSEMEDGQVFIASRTFPLGTMVQWLLDAGLTLERLAEPEPLPIPTMDEAEIHARVPYDSDAWRDLYPQIARVPVVAVFAARAAGQREFKPGDM